MKSPKVPRLLTDVFRDLRDRHLLLPVAALAVALVVIPMMLEGTVETAPAPAPVVSGAGEASAVTSAVLADDQVSVRNYRKRLEDLKSKNPFKQQFTAPVGGGDDPTADTGDGDPVPASDDSQAPIAPGEVPPVNDSVVVDETATNVDETTTDVDEPVDEAGGNPSGDGNETKPNDPKPEDVETVSSLFTRRVDLMVGLEGAPELKENVKPMTILPDDTTPVVAFLGTDEAGKRAAFVVAKDATVVAGNGACVPAPENCLYLTLKKGETATLDFGPDGQTFELRLLEIRDVEL